MGLYDKLENIEERFEDLDRSAAQFCEDLLYIPVIGWVILWLFLVIYYTLSWTLKILFWTFKGVVYVFHLIWKKHRYKKSFKKKEGGGSNK